MKDKYNQRETYETFRQINDHLSLEQEKKEREKRWAKMNPIVRFFAKLFYYCTQVLGGILAYVFFALVVGAGFGIIVLLIQGVKLLLFGEGE